MISSRRSTPTGLRGSSPAFAEPLRRSRAACGVRSTQGCTGSTQSYTACGVRSTQSYTACGVRRRLRGMTTWEYATLPLLTHATKQILDQWGADGWELVQVVPGPTGSDNLVAYMKRPKND